MTTPQPTAADAKTASAPKFGLSRSRLKLGVVLTVVVAVIGVGAWYWSQPVPLTPAEQGAEAIRLFDAGQLVEARAIAQRLVDRRLDTEDQAGELRYILGMIALRTDLPVYVPEPIEETAEEEPAAEADDHADHGSHGGHGHGATKAPAHGESADHGHGHEKKADDHGSSSHGHEKASGGHGTGHGSSHGSGHGSIRRTRGSAVVTAHFTEADHASDVMFADDEAVAVQANTPAILPVSDHGAADDHGVADGHGAADEHNAKDHGHGHADEPAHGAAPDDHGHSDHGDSGHGHEHGATTHEHGTTAEATTADVAPRVVTPEEQRAAIEQAITLFRQAEEFGVPEARRPSWAFNLGKCLYLTDDLLGAQPLLEESLTFEAGRDEAGEMLVDIFLDPAIQTEELLAKALQLCQDRLARVESTEGKDLILTQQAEVQLAQEHLQDAANSLAQLSPEGHASARGSVLTARIQFANQEWQAAIDTLSHMPAEETPSVAARHASLIKAMAYEQLVAHEAIPAQAERHRQQAVEQYRATIKSFPNTPEFFVASVHVGDLYRLEGSREQALQAYTDALKLVRSDVKFQNRWITAAEFEERMLNAWEGWLNAREFNEAITLAKALSPLLPLARAQDLTARAHQRWAETTDLQLESLRQGLRETRREEQRQRWFESGVAFAALAETLGRGPEYAEALWASCDHFRRAGASSQALAQVERFLRSRPAALLPTAMTQRAELLLDLDRLEESQNVLQRVVSEYATDPVVFRAQYLLGDCLYEQRQYAAALGAWRSVLESPSLRPDALEWRQSLLASGRLQAELSQVRRMRHQRLTRGDQAAGSTPAELTNVETAATSTPTTEPAVTTDNTSNADQASVAGQPVEAAETVDELPALAQASAADAVRRLTEFVTRYPDHTDVLSTRFVLAQAQLERAYWQQQELADIETPAGLELARGELDRTLAAALSELEQARDGWQNELAQDRLSTTEQRSFKSCLYAIPHTLFALNRFEDAVVGYSVAANRDPQDPQILLAYLQMAECYSRLGRRLESYNMLEQAKVLLSQGQFTDAAFAASATTLTRAEWSEWLERIGQIHGASLLKSAQARTAEANGGAGTPNSSNVAGNAAAGGTP